MENRVQTRSGRVPTNPTAFQPRSSTSCVTLEDIPIIVNSRTRVSTFSFIPYIQKSKEFSQ